MVKHKLTPMPEPSRLRLSDLPSQKPSPFRYLPTAETLSKLRENLRLTGLRKVRLEGEISPSGPAEALEWHLSARLGATVVQPCTVSLEPVTTRIDLDVTRHYVSELPEPDGDDVEMPEDDALEELRTEIDLGALLAEELSLALPAYPRATHLDEALAFTAAPPGAAPLQDAEIKPFAGLKALRDQMAKQTASETGAPPDDPDSSDTARDDEKS